MSPCHDNWCESRSTDRRARAEERRPVPPADGGDHHDATRSPGPRLIYPEQRKRLRDEELPGEIDLELAPEIIDRQVQQRAREEHRSELRCSRSASG
jgi:hypothetical protein